MKCQWLQRFEIMKKSGHGGANSNASTIAPSPAAETLGGITPIGLTQQKLSNKRKKMLLQ